MITKYEINKFITEANNEVGKEILFTALDQKQKTLLISAMKTGKTTFIMKYLSDILKSSGIQLIFVTPVKSLMNDIKNKYPHSIKCNGNVKEIRLNDNAPILTTPESMHKVINTCEEENKEFFIVYDEIHQVVINANFREKLKNPLLYYENKLCIGLLGMTATPEPLENIEFDERFLITPKEKFIQSDKTIIVKDFTKNTDNMLNFIKKIKTENPNRLIVSRINNREDIKLIKAKLNNCVSWYRSKDERKENRQYSSDMELLEEVLNGQNIENIDYLLCTSLIDVGVEIQLKEKPIVIDFLDNTSTIIDDIQFVGRFRQGIKQLYLVGKLNKEKPITKPLDLRSEYNKQLEETKEFIKVTNKIKDRVIGDITKDVIGIKSVLSENDDILYEIDEYSLMQNVFKRYINFHLQTAIYLKLFLEKHQTFNTKEIHITSYNDLNISESDELKKEKKELKEYIKNHEKEFFNNIKVLNLDNEILKMILNIEDIDNKDLWKIKRFDDTVSLWKEEHLEGYRKRYKQVSEILENTKVNQIEILEIALKKEKVKKLVEQKRYINSNIYYDKQRELIPRNKEMFVTYKIRDYINKTKGKERGVYLSNKFKKELLQQLQKEKSLSKLTPISLDKHLELIYNISNNKKDDIISSLKTNV